MPVITLVRYIPTGGISLAGGSLFQVTNWTPSGGKTETLELLAGATGLPSAENVEVLTAAITEIEEALREAKQAYESDHDERNWFLQWTPDGGQTQSKLIIGGRIVPVNKIHGQVQMYPSGGMAATLVLDCLPHWESEEYRTAESATLNTLYDTLALEGNGTTESRIAQIKITANSSSFTGGWIGIHLTEEVAPIFEVEASEMLGSKCSLVDGLYYSGAHAIAFAFDTLNDPSEDYLVQNIPPTGGPNLNKAQCGSYLILARYMCGAGTFALTLRHGIASDEKRFTENPVIITGPTEEAIPRLVVLAQIDIPNLPTKGLPIQEMPFVFDLQGEMLDGTLDYFHVDCLIPIPADRVLEFNGAYCVGDTNVRLITTSEGKTQGVERTAVGGILWRYVNTIANQWNVPINGGTLVWAIDNGTLESAGDVESAVTDLEITIVDRWETWKEMV